ncbi:MAG: class I SAM-dependent methyltransferase, partial [Spirochaetes bacterium]|nr:class I SAM-dependent methyltransferase [Spirochaetota bacterium]
MSDRYSSVNGEPNYLEGERRENDPASPCGNRDHLFEALERYRGIVPGPWQDFAASVRTTQPVTVWRNAPRIGHHAFESWMEEYEGVRAEQSAWDPRLYRLRPTAPEADPTAPAPQRLKPGNLLAFGAGLYHVQEEAAALPATLIAPGTGARILDMCAAPGNKSAQLAEMVGPEGTVVANDVNERRFQGGIPTWERLGLANIAATVYDGRNLPHLGPVFDAVLVDAPCTGEGTCRRNPGALRPTSDAFKERLYETQAALLHRAVELCRPGGTIIYCTCTFAPEENEMQVDRLMRGPLGATVEPLPIEVPGMDLKPGIDQWADLTFDPATRMTARIWPHLNDTGGFFVAVLRKRGVRRGDSASEPRLPRSEA